MASPLLRAITMIRSRMLSLLSATATVVKVRSVSPSTRVTACSASCLMASIRSIGSVRGTCTTASTKVVGPTRRSRVRSTATTPATLRMARWAVSVAPSGARSSSVSTVVRASRTPSSEMMTATPMAAAASPQP